MSMLENSSAAAVFTFFERLSQYPRCSHHEKAASNYLKQWAEGKGLPAIQDESYNLIVKKPGTPGYENSPAVILQSHIDMVCEKNKDVRHDFEKDPILIIQDGDFLHADGTTLGGDNGIGVAYAQAVLDSTDLPHPPIEAVFTVQEEVGMNGVNAMDLSQLEGRTLINMDSEEEGFFIVSNAGGRHFSVTLLTKWVDAPAGTEFYRLSVTGLVGGHSGMDINKGRGNANRLLSRVLHALHETLPGCRLADIEGGSKENAIPRDASCLLGLPAGSEGILQSTVSAMEEVFRHELHLSDPGVKLVLKQEAPAKKVLAEGLLEETVAFLLLAPNGVQSMSSDIEGLVESSNNLGVVSTTEEGVQFILASRSSVKSRKELITAQVETLANNIGASTTILSDYPAWEYRPDSKIREVFMKCYRELSGREGTVTALHAGLECGVFSEGLPGSDIISFGPDLYDVHSPKEKLSISSAERGWELLKKVLAELK